MFIMLSFAVMGAWMLVQAGASVLLLYRVDQLRIGYSDTNYSAIVAIGWFAQGLATMIFGYVTDAEKRRFGSRLRLLWASIGAFPITVLLLDQARSWPELYLSWFALECVAGALTAVCFGIAGEYISDDFIGGMSGVFGSMPGIALLVGIAVADIRFTPDALLFWLPAVVSLICLLPLAIYYTANHRLMVVADTKVKAPYSLGITRFVILVAMITSAAASVQTYPVQYLTSEALIPAERIPEELGWLGLASVSGVVIGSLISGAAMTRLRGGLEVIAAAALVQTIGLALMHSASASGFYLVFYFVLSLGIGATAGTLTATAVWTLGRHGYVGRNLGLISAAQTVPYFVFPVFAVLSRQTNSWHETMDSMFVIAAALSLLSIVPIAWNRIRPGATAR